MLEARDEEQKEGRIESKNEEKSVSGINSSKEARISIHVGLANFFIVLLSLRNAREVDTKFLPVLTSISA